MSQVLLCLFLLTEDLSKLGTVFHDAAESTRTRSKHDWFDTAVVEIHGDDLQDFIEGVQAGLAESNY